MHAIARSFSLNPSLINPITWLLRIGQVSNQTTSLNNIYIYICTLTFVVYVQMD